MSVCGGWSLEAQEGNVRKCITMWCHAWSCPDCAPYRAAALRRFACDGDPRTFLTLTVNPRTNESAEARARDLSDALKIMIKRARRKFTKAPIEYLAVFEETKKGEPHLHLLMRAPYIPQRWLSAQMDELIRAPIVDIRRVGSAKQAAFYVSKYVSKATRTFGKLKRYWSSKGYDLQAAYRERKEKTSWSPWFVNDCSVYTAAQKMASLGFAVTWISENEWWHFNGARLVPP